MEVTTESGLFAGTYLHPYWQENWCFRSHRRHNVVKFRRVGVVGGIQQNVFDSSLIWVSASCARMVAMHSTLEQPIRILITLLKHPGEVVLRQETRKATMAEQHSC
jgi:hypothetical protein